MKKASSTVGKQTSEKTRLVKFKSIKGRRPGRPLPRGPRGGKRKKARFLPTCPRYPPKRSSPLRKARSKIQDCFRRRRRLTLSAGLRSRFRAHSHTRHGGVVGRAVPSPARGGKRKKARFLPTCPIPPKRSSPLRKARSKIQDCFRGRRRLTLSAGLRSRFRAHTRDTGGSPAAPLGTRERRHRSSKEVAWRFWWIPWGTRAPWPHV